MALCGVDRPVIVSAAEHDSVLAPAKRASDGATVVPDEHRWRDRPSGPEREALLEEREVLWCR